MRTLVQPNRASVYVSLRNVCPLYLLCWDTLGLVMLYFAFYMLLSWMTPPERLYLVTRMMSYAHGIGCGERNAMLSKEQLDRLSCRPGRTSCTGQ